MKKYCHIVFLMLAAVLPLSCTTPIQSIVAHPDSYNGRNVKVKGKVINTLHLDDLSFFTVKGGSKKLNVITNDFLPVVGDNVKVKGKVLSKFYYQRDTMLVIRESVCPKERRGITIFNKAVN